jgi:bifunctional ADP-heptose synthase (sugar kinase/adenylyltransferase)
MLSTIKLIESIRDYRVLFVGDHIVDEYHYVKPLAKAAKEHLIPMRYIEKEVFDGGVVAAANHLKTFCKTVEVCKGNKTIRKVRMVDKDHLRKLAEIHYEEEGGWNDPLEGVHDVVVIADFGHGAIPAPPRRGGEFLAVSAQSNSANMGFNLITKYPSADYIVIDEPEARLAAADRDSPIEVVIRNLARDRCEKFVVTHGRYGAYGYDNGRFYHCKAFTDLVRDTMGAGDAFFSITAPMAKTGSMEDLLLIGNAAGALKTQIVGHRSSVTKEALIGFIAANSKGK